MDYRVDNITKKRVKDGVAVYTTKWSGLSKAHKYNITSKVPARPGIFELYYKTGENEFKLFYMERVWYGGLRSEIRRASDPGEVTDRARRKVLSEKECYYRYTIVESKQDMKDLLYRFSISLLPDRTPPAHSGRYSKIVVTD
ncbi:MAG: hypothetical protein JEZ04_07295 [Spirochaetales bacterium]|nr:hypothetical protein [Spirochaetales bacterium]